jgi:hypothetical protein
MSERKLSVDTITAMQAMLIGNRVKVTGCKSKNIMPDGTFNLGNVIGECTFFGYNPHFPSFGLQITVDRLPVINIDISQIKLLENDK